MTKDGTRYKVLLQAKDDSTWHEAKTVIARSAEAAVRAFVEQDGAQAATTGARFVAVTERGWRPLTPKVETTTRVTFGTPEPEKAKEAKS